MARAGSSGKRKRIWVRLAAAAATTVAVQATGTVSASAATVVQPDSVTAVGDPGVALSAPSDGRTAGDGFLSEVTGVGIGYRFGSGKQAWQARPGQRLVAFSLAGTLPGQNVNGNTVTGTLIVDGVRQPLPAQPPNPPVDYLASVPVDTRDVAVQLAAGGLAQTFSVTAGAREGVQPAVLYRDRLDWQTVDQIGETINFPTPDPAAGLLASASTDVELTSATLTWFGPDPTDPTPADQSKAWLVLDLTSGQHDPNVLESLTYTSGLSGQEVTLTQPGGQPVPSTVTGRGGPNDLVSAGTGITGGIYYFQVPADLTTATLTVTPSTLQVASSYDPAGTSATAIPVAGSGTFALDFGSVYQPPPPVAPPVQTARQATAANPGVVGRSSRSLYLWIFSLVAVAAAAAAAIYRHRRRCLLRSPGHPRRRDRHDCRPPASRAAKCHRPDPPSGDRHATAPHSSPADTARRHVLRPVPPACRYRCAATPSRQPHRPPFPDIGSTAGAGDGRRPGARRPGAHGPLPAPRRDGGSADPRAGSSRRLARLPARTSRSDRDRRLPRPAPGRPHRRRPRRCPVQR